MEKTIIKNSVWKSGLLLIMCFVAAILALLIVVNASDWINFALGVFFTLLFGLAVIALAHQIITKDK